MNWSRVVTLSFTAMMFLSAAAVEAAQQPPAGAQPGGPGRGTPPPPQNLQILPKDIAREQLLTIMRG